MISIIASLLLLQVPASDLQVRVKLIDRPLPKTSVQLVEFLPDKEPRFHTRSTNAQGVARFPKNLFPDGRDFIFLAEHLGITYFSTGFRSPVTTSQFEILVFPTVESSSELKIEDLRLSLELKEDALVVDQVMLVTNQSQSTVVGVGPNEQSREVFRFDLPPQGFDLKFGEGFQESLTRFDGNAVVIARPLSPGSIYLRALYRIEKPGRSYSFLQNFTIPVQNLSVSFPQNAFDVEGPFESSGTKHFGTEWWTLREAQPHSKVIAFQITGLPWSLPWAQVLTPLISILLFGLALFVSKRRHLIEDEGRAGRMAQILNQCRELEKRRSQNLLEESEFLSRRFELWNELADLWGYTTTRKNSS